MHLCTSLLPAVRINGVRERRVVATRSPEAEGPAEEAQPGPDRAVLEHSEDAGGPARPHRRHSLRRGVWQEVELPPTAAGT